MFHAHTSRAPLDVAGGCGLLDVWSELLVRNDSLIFQKLENRTILSFHYLDITKQVVKNLFSRVVAHTTPIQSATQHPVLVPLEGRRCAMRRSLLLAPRHSCIH